MNYKKKSKPHNQPAGTVYSERKEGGSSGIALILGESRSTGDVVPKAMVTRVSEKMMMVWNCGGDEDGDDGNGDKMAAC